MPEFLDHTILVLPKFKYMHDRLLGPSYKHINTLKIHENARLLVAYIGFLCIALDFRGHWIRWNIRRRDNKSLMNFRICFIVIHWIEFATIIQNQVFFCFWMMRFKMWRAIYFTSLLCSWLFKNGLRPWEMPVIYILEWAQVLMHMAIFFIPTMGEPEYVRSSFSRSEREKKILSSSSRKSSSGREY